MVTGYRLSRGRNGDGLDHREPEAVSLVGAGAAGARAGGIVLMRAAGTRPVSPALYQRPLHRGQERWSGLSPRRPSALGRNAARRRSDRRQPGGSGVRDSKSAGTESRRGRRRATPGPSRQAGTERGPEPRTSSVPLPASGGPEAEPVLVAASKQQQIIGDPGQPRGLVRRAPHGISQLLPGAPWAPGELEFAAQHREGRAQLGAGARR